MNRDRLRSEPVLRGSEGTQDAEWGEVRVRSLFESSDDSHAKHLHSGTQRMRHERSLRHLLMMNAILAAGLIWTLSRRHGAVRGQRRGGESVSIESGRAVRRRRRSPGWAMLRLDNASR